MVNKYDIVELDTPRLWHFLYKITRNGRPLSREQVAKVYKPLSHYPFTDCGWAYYHLQELRKIVCS